MDIFIGFVVGAVIGVVVMFLVARNNKKKFNEAMNLDPKAKWDEMVKELKDRISK